MGMPPFVEFDALTILTTIFWVWMMIDCLFNRRLQGGSKVFWFLFIFFTHLFGAIIYFFFRCTHKNPIDALTYYYQSVTQSAKPKANPQPPPPVQKPYQDYEQGYRPPQEAAPPAQPIQASEVPYYQPEAQYEQPTASYPEMPQEQ